MQNKQKKNLVKTKRLASQCFSYRVVVLTLGIFFYVSRELCKNTAKTVIVLLLLQNRKRFIVVPLFYYTLLFYKMEYCSLPLPFCVLQCGSSIMNFPSILAFTK